MTTNLKKFGSSSYVKNLLCLGMPVASRSQKFNITPIYAFMMMMMIIILFATALGNVRRI
uniref:Uncharacterized protein n=1 Tax=Romanomermis culicivorax TaxID=13658 RepID=A0A915KS08_ROMCU